MRTIRSFRCVLTAAALAALWLIPASVRAGTVTNTLDSGAGSLRQAIEDAVNGDTITFTNTLSGQTIVLTNGQITVDKNLTIDASSLTAGIVLDGNGASRIFEFAGGTTNVLSGLTLANGYTTGSGGAIYLNSNAVLRIQNSTLCGNSANNGGGILNAGGTLTLENATFSGNSVTQVGGGIYNNGSLTITNCTLSGNSANHSGGIYCQPPGWFSLYNSIVAGNTASNYANIYGTYAEYGETYNLVGGDPMLAPLGNYGGPTQTMPPLSGSPAINTGAATSLTTDQRGAPRFDGKPDIGAVESQSVVRNTADNGDGTLRDAVRWAPSGDSITFINTLTGQTIVLSSGQITISKSLTIDAASLTNGITISGNDASRIFEFTASTTNVLTRLTLTHGYTSGNGGAIYLNDSASLTIDDSTLSGNSAYSGGGIYGKGTLTLNNSTFSGNSAQYYGGGIDNIFATLTLNNCTLSGNSAKDGGGMDTFSGRLTLNNCTLSGNSANHFGGGIAFYSGTHTLNNTIVAGNTAPSDTNFYGSYSGANNLIDGNPMLAPLGNYGGPTQTMPPQIGSPALDAGGATTLTTDQRGMPRVLSAGYGAPAVDIGAVEYNGWLAGKDVSGTDPAYFMPDSIYDGSTVFPAGFDPETAGLSEILSKSGKDNLIAQGESNVTADPETYGLYTESAFQALALDRPFLTRNADSNSFTLTVGILQAPDLFTTFSNLTGFATSPDPDNGQINIEFAAPNSSARFFEVYGDTPSGR